MATTYDASKELGMRLGLGARAGRASTPRLSDATLAQIVYQSTHVNDPRPNGNPNDWGTQGRANLGYDNSKFAFAVPWGVIAIADGQSPNSDVVIKVQDIRLAVQADGGWQTYTFPMRLAGRYIVESFEGEEDGRAALVSCSKSRHYRSGKRLRLARLS